MTQPPIGQDHRKRGSRGASPGDPGQALSSGQAARFCYVTSDTIVNWIRTGSLKAQRTAGGQYRICVTDLRAFMVAGGMSTALLDAEADIRPYCWEFHCEVGSPSASSRAMGCEACLVRRSGTLNCWTLHGLLPVTARRVGQCEQCDYYRRFHPAPDAGAGRTAPPLVNGGER
jgi:excisionase family DNA binding protein